jgi:hypothetical protein
MRSSPDALPHPTPAVDDLLGGVLSAKYYHPAVFHFAQFGLQKSTLSLSYFKLLFLLSF